MSAAGSTKVNDYSQVPAQQLQQTYRSAECMFANHEGKGIEMESVFLY